MFMIFTFRKPMEGTFPQKLVNDFIHSKLKEVVKCQYIINKDVLNYKSACGKTYNFGKYSLPIVF